MIEAIASHQLWELREGFLNPGTTISKPRRRTLAALKEIMPEATDEEAMVHGVVQAEDVSAKVGDAVFFSVGDGQHSAGELLLSF